MVDVSAQDVCNTTASRTFDKILEIIQSSNLNFQLKISPFSALISLKKSLVKDKLGVPLSPPFNPQLTDISGDALAALIAKNLKLERDLESLRVNYEHSVDDCVTSHKTIKTLQSQLQIVETDHIKIEAEDVPEKNILIDSLNHEIRDLERKNKVQKEISDKFNKELSETKVKMRKEKQAILKEHRTEVKYWRNKLGDLSYSPS